MLRSPVVSSVLSISWFICVAVSAGFCFYFVEYLLHSWLITNQSHLVRRLQLSTKITFYVTTLHNKLVSIRRDPHQTHQIQNKIFPLQVFLLCVGHVYSTGSGCSTCAGEECGHVAGLFTKPHLPPGLNLITRIPAGVCNLNVTLLKPHNNHLGKILEQEIKLCFLWKCFWNVVHINATQPMNSLKSWEHPSRS